MAIACLRLFTVPPLPALPERSVPRFFLRMALATLFCAPVPYFREDFFLAGMLNLLRFELVLGSADLFPRSFTISLVFVFLSQPAQHVRGFLQRRFSPSFRDFGNIFACVVDNFGQHALQLGRGSFSLNRLSPGIATHGRNEITAFPMNCLREGL